MGYVQDDIKIGHSDHIKLICLIGRFIGLIEAVISGVFHANSSSEYSVTVYLVCILDCMFAPSVTIQC